ncbi:MAG: hypothetical protein JOY80_07450, partial [Candidatus Dormibacteraeota bacterium]|nr:hypothetical protein [Candidatus Dormibacteraeota bacterium]
MRRTLPKRWTFAAGVAGLAAAGTMLAPLAARAGGSPFLNSFTTSSTVSPTIPANGDVNPYGVVVVRRSAGALVAGDVLVSNFNNAPSTPGGGNLQGTGSTIVQVSPSGNSEAQFAHLTPARLHGACPGGVGLTTALGILNSKWVIVGSLPTKDGSAATAGAGCLIL